MKAKVLVGCPTSSFQKYCLKEYAEAVKKLTYSAYDVLLVDNSQNDLYLTKVKSYGLPVLKGAWFEGARQRIVTSRNLLREQILSKNYDYFLSLEQDVIPPKDIIERLVHYNKEVISGVYFTVKDKALRPLLVAKHPEKESFHYLDSDKILEYPSILEVSFCGLGCLLISRKVLEKISFRYVEGNKSFDDFWFCKDATKEGFSIFADPKVVCNHLFLSRDWDLKK